MAQNSSLDRMLAVACKKCTVCKIARKNQAGAIFWFVSKIEGKFCPFCKAYERVYGKKAHEKM